MVKKSKHLSGDFMHFSVISLHLLLNYDLPIRLSTLAFSRNASSILHSVWLGRESQTMHHRCAPVNRPRPDTFDRRACNRWRIFLTGTRNILTTGRALRQMGFWLFSRIFTTKMSPKKKTSWQFLVIVVVRAIPCGRFSTVALHSSERGFPRFSTQASPWAA